MSQIDGNPHAPPLPPDCLLYENLSDTEIKFGDYIRLKGLNTGDIVYLKDVCDEIRVILIGNGTPYEGVTDTSNDGWDYKRYNQFKVLAIYKHQLQTGQSFLTPDELEFDYIH